MTTAQEVFDIAVRLMDEQDDASGDTCTEDTRTYLLRTPSLLNSLLDRCASAAGTTSSSCGGCAYIHDMSDPVDLDEELCTGVLPYGLAGLLLAEEDPGRADFFWQTYQEQLRWSAYGLPAVEEDIEDFYDVTLASGGFGGW